MSSARTWIGGANLPTRYLRVNATRPFAKLAVDAGQIYICLRPRLAARLFRADELAGTPGNVECVYPAVGRLFRGVGVRTTDGRDYYFRTAAGDEILAAARLGGFTVPSENREPTKIWNPAP